MLDCTPLACTYLNVSLSKMLVMVQSNKYHTMNRVMNRSPMLVLISFNAA